MDLTLIDVTNIPGVQLDDEVVLLGQAGGAFDHRRGTREDCGNAFI